MTTTETSGPANGTAAPNTSQPGKALAPVSAIKQGLEQMRPQFAVALPKHISPERFERTVLTAMNNNPDLLTADKRSLFNACSKAAQDGLLPDGREGALVIFKDKNGKKQVQWMPMVFGLIKKIRQSGEVDSIGARIVFSKEIEAKRFEFIVTDGREQLRHEPMLWGDRGEKVLVYAYARFKSGHVEYLPLHRDDILKRKKASRAQSGPWQSWEDEMWLKTAIRAQAKRMPLSAEVMRTIERDDEPTTFERLKNEAQDISAAASQFSAPAIEDHSGEAIDAEVTEGDESSLDRGRRLLALCTTEKEADDLWQSIADELAEDQQDEWDRDVASRRLELKAK